MANRAGVLYGADNTTFDKERAGNHNETIVAQAHGKYYEPSSRGVLFSAGNGTARSPQASLTTTAPFVIYNPVGSGKRVAIKKVGLSHGASGTQGAGVIYHCGFTLNGPTATQTGVIPTGTAVTPKNLGLANGANNSVCTVLENVTLNAAPAALYPLAQTTSEVGQTTAAPISNVVDDVDGAITLDPGSGYCVMGVSTGSSSPLIFVGVVWEEIPIAA